MITMVVEPIPAAFITFQMGPLDPSERPYSTDHGLEVALENKAHKAVAGGTSIDERDDRHCEALSVFDPVAFNCDCWGGHLALLG